MEECRSTEDVNGNMGSLVFSQVMDLAANNTVRKTKLLQFDRRCASRGG